MEQNRFETAKMIMSFYNMMTGHRCKVGDNVERADVIVSAIERAGGQANLKAHIRKYAGEHKDDANWRECFETAGMDQVTAQPTQVQPVTEQAVGNAMGLLEQAVVGMIAKTSAEKIESEIMGSVEQTIRDFIKEEYGSIERKITTVVDGRKAELQGVQHEKFETVVKFVANNEPVFLVGPAGSGKNELCKQVAEALGLKFYFTNAVTQEYKLTGFTDANGKFQETQFYKAFTQGGLFMLDEMDASIPEVLVILNAAIANGYFDFPAPIGYVEAHPDFRVIAAGNTIGQGASYEYVGRTQLDGASFDRFAIVKVDYSVTIENLMAGNDLELANFCREYRKVANEAGLNIIVSYRAIKRLAKMTQLLDLVEAIDTCLTKGLEKDDLNIIAGKLSESKYKNAIKRLATAA